MGPRGSRLNTNSGVLEQEQVVKVSHDAPVLQTRGFQDIVNTVINSLNVCSVGSREHNGNHEISNRVLRET